MNPKYNVGRVFHALCREHITEEDRGLDKRMKLRFNLPSSYYGIGKLPETREVYEAEFLYELRKLRHRWTAKQAFLDANPHVKPRAQDWGWACGHMLGTGWRCMHHGSPACTQRINHGVYRDHGELWKAWSKPNGIFLIGHPYNTPRPEENEKHVLPSDLRAVILPEQYSWYNPGLTTLTFIARPDVIEALTLDYHVPPYEDTHPTYGHYTEV